MLAPLSTLWIAAAVAGLAWARWRRRRNAAERAQCERLLEQYDIA
jgi:hypothetical protein